MPTDVEWTTLITYLGGESVAGSKMKEIGTTHWSSPNSDATNESGFSAIGSGARYYSNGTFYTLLLYGNYWSNTQVDISTAWYRSMNYGATACYRYGSDGYKKSGFAVRLVKD